MKQVISIFSIDRRLLISILSASLFLGVVYYYFPVKLTIALQILMAIVLLLLLNISLATASVFLYKGLRRLYCHFLK